MKLHFVGLPHTKLTQDYEWCAYTMKLKHMLQICEMIDQETVLYDVFTDEDRKKYFGHIDWNTEVFGGWNPQDPWWIDMNTRVIEQMKQQLEPGDIICIIAGRCQQAIADAFPYHRTVEWAVGYDGILLDKPHCFESNAWRHYVYGKYGINDGRFFDTVIPNSFDAKDFTISEERGDYLLYLGRMTPRKGMAIIEELAKENRIITAGQGEYRVPNTEHMGVVTGKDKAWLLANAKAVLVPTQYIEPFGGVAVEAMLSGTPVITTDFGAFTETVDNGKTGFRCKTLREFKQAIEDVKYIWPYDCREWASTRYTLEAVAYDWKAWFQQLETLYRKGWYE